MEKSKPYPNRDGEQIFDHCVPNQPNTNLFSAFLAVEAGKISRSGSAQNIHPSSRESSIPRQQPQSRNASQNARPPTSTSSSSPMLSADELKRATVTIYQEYDSNNDLKVSWV